jgi:hypothetical protein
MWVSPTLCELGGTNQEVIVVCDSLLAMDPGDITRMTIAAVALSSNGLV